MEILIRKIADFGMARLFNIDQTQTLASKVVGTLGYMSPEYVIERQVSVKSDVYSFGVLVLEIVSGKAITSFSSDEDQESLTSFAWKNWTAGTAWNLVDPAIIQTGSSTEILRCIHIGLLCVQDNLIDRPTMSSIDLMLNSYSITLEAPLYPAFFTDSNYLPTTLSQWTATGTTASKSSNKSAADSVNGVSITELHPR
ncbi:Cysteine-rich receptor-like protein kinase 10 [Bienertia sinuspersici]